MIDQIIRQRFGYNLNGLTICRVVLAVICWFKVIPQKQGEEIAIATFIEVHSPFQAPL